METIDSKESSRLDQLLMQYEYLRKSCQYDDLSDSNNKILIETWETQCLAAIIDIAGENSIYYRQSFQEYNGNKTLYISKIVGAIKALARDIKKGYLDSVRSLIHADIFSDFLEMAEYLLKEGYKDAAAVLCGGVLEEHICKLAGKARVTLKKENGDLKKTSALNDELKNMGVYNNISHKSVTSWLSIRNDAAHGKYNGYSSEQVKLFIDGVRLFIRQLPY